MSTQTIDAAAVKAIIAARFEEFVHTLFGDRAKRAGQNAYRIGTKGSLSVEEKNANSSIARTRQERAATPSPCGSTSTAGRCWKPSKVREMGGRGRERFPASPAPANRSTEAKVSALRDDL